MADRTDFRASGISPDPAITSLVALAHDRLEHGWQPADLVHVLAGADRDARLAHLAAVIVLDHAHVNDAAHRAPVEWRRQVEALTHDHPRAADALANASVVDVLAALPRGTVDLARSMLRFVQDWPILVDPPSRWPAAGAAPSHTASPPPDGHRLFDRIRALLAKAENTEFPDEAEAFTAKAQHLMSRYAIDAALLRSHTDAPTAVGARRIHVDTPYALEKVQLLCAVAAANRARTLWYEQARTATVVGTQVDLDQIAVLFSSLLVQAVRAMARTDPEGEPTTSFRRGFLLGYADRIGQRLRHADTRATLDVAAAASLAVADVLPAVAATEHAVDTEFARLFPRTRTSSRRSRGAMSGWAAGRTAADSADIA
ncbi:DUF2786 domain-containing protein [Rhodococcus rhodnii]|uniref:DUF2786 domain-containing protein n=2 Tax=Rhodococcus rhodnii TaxID=38312 RepID=R7WQJ3_9NOCA|nr:DUF2786 domain-containing protein [Rhodococcus rhodnii]EOM77591.1 hypothetical protein Rrhod_1001 [Rhodococcus rhodnii LMG 5362]TXG90232.1 DUF2786 domain-containing protein [Rhodococcus rhodnii]